MRAYEYRAIVTPNKIVTGNITSGEVFIPLSAELKTGYVIGETPDQACEHARDELKLRYPAELGYKEPAGVYVIPLEEIIIERPKE